MESITEIKPQEPEQGGIFDGAPVISSYTRAEAIEDGTLVDVTETAKEAGFGYPICVTRHLFDEWINPDYLKDVPGQSMQGRLWDVLTVLKFRGQASRGEDFIEYVVLFIDKTRHKKKVKIWAICDGGDDGKPVITIMLPEDY